MVSFFRLVTQEQVFLEKSAFDKRAVFSSKIDFVPTQTKCSMWTTKKRNLALQLVL